MGIRLKCPKCNSKQINQYRTIVGPIWCENCGYKVQHKENSNPFLYTELVCEECVLINQHLPCEACKR